jgi:hypothetical protein
MQGLIIISLLKKVMRLLNKFNIVKQQLWQYLCSEEFYIVAISMIPVIGLASSFTSSLEGSYSYAYIYSIVVLLLGYVSYAFYNIIENYKMKYIPNAMIIIIFMICGLLAIMMASAASGSIINQLSIQNTYNINNEFLKCFTMIFTILAFLSLLISLLCVFGCGFYIKLPPLELLKQELKDWQLAGIECINKDIEK